ncbi:MAG: glucose-1-phosphate cytidylyltransferase [Gemmatimonadetes bacterium]|nr:glucose-1-phosphate cytidylyltransferase [Gemmatimonadota bacterium]
MKAIILAGGFGTRLSEETVIKPKPLVDIGGKPILWHIMNIYACQGVDEFIVALGYKGDVIKEYFLNFYAINNDISVDLATGETTIHQGNQPPWKVHLVDTGLHTMTGGRLGRLRAWLGDDETFMFTYGDGVADVDLKAALEFHKSHGKMATVTTVRAPARFGRISFDGDQVRTFHEKSQAGEGWINGGFFVLEPGVFDYINGDETVWEREPVENLARAGELVGYRHDGFWSCMDTLKEKNLLEDMWNGGKAPWRIW